MNTDANKEEADAVGLLKALGVLALVIAGLWIMFTSGHDDQPSRPSYSIQIGACMDASRNEAKHPSSVSFSMLNAPQAMLSSTGKILVKAPFTAKNGFGNEVPLEARCMFDGSTLIDISVQNR